MMPDLKETTRLIKNCAGCGECASGSGTSAPVCPSGEFYRFETYFPRGRLIMAKALVDGKLDFESALEKLYACNLCGNCAAQCDLDLSTSIIDIFEAVRAEALKNGFVPQALEPVAKNLAEKDNIYGKPRRDRGKWLKNMKIKRLPADRARILYFAGCASSLDTSTQPLARATARLLKGIGLDVGVLGEDEVCCGSPALRIGDRETFERLARKNIEMINLSGADTVVTSCAECLKTFRSDYPGGLKAEVMHTAEFLDRLLWHDEMSFTREVNLTAAYHDPCNLGRLSGVYEGPRRVLNRIPGVVIREMDRTKENAFCCGAGGGVSSAFPDMAKFTAETRIREAEATGVTHLITACPFCFKPLSKAIKKTGSNLKLMDLVQIAGQAI